ncbi:Proteasome subunit beta type-1 [Parelaphostrongylus tenuis]|uniref:Proteasome subunit beta type-1 n=1 Tax=Parelaphostrongylus tenuis TaxID=148309 RepID=A0AAD5MY41_PARTN|nr:Proteasome subunit beta type-1 [Parelaphostrongylus tenuis]
MATSFGIPYDAIADPLQELRAFKAAMNDAKTNPDWRTSRHIERQRWNPYSFEGGSTCALSGENFAIVASDTRMSQMEINIITRDAEKVHVLNDSIVFGNFGFLWRCTSAQACSPGSSSQVPFRLSYRHEC